MDNIGSMPAIEMNGMQNINANRIFTTLKFVFYSLVFVLKLPVILTVQEIKTEQVYSDNQKSSDVLHITGHYYPVISRINSTG